jgi:hypothetical protein
MEMARELGLQLIFWPHPAALKSADAKQAAWMEKLRAAEDLPEGSQMMGGSSIRDLIHDLLELLRPKPETVAPAGVNGGDKVYLLYDTTVADDVAFASKLGELISGRKMSVFVPDPNLSANSDRLPRHENLMKACNAVLLYRGAATSPDNWLFQTMPDVLWAERKYGREPLKAKTFLLNDPTPLEGIGDVQLIPCAGEFSPQKLDPFFARFGK